MNKKNLPIIIFTISAAIGYYFYNVTNKHQSLDSKMLVVSIMVKNEETAMALTLQPLIDAGITQFFIYDTGSTDNTIAATRNFFIKNNIKNFVIEQGPWIDFAASRNQALKLTEQYFPCATFMLMLDAEWILHNGCELLKFCDNQKNTKHVVYSILSTNGKFTTYEDRLIRTKSNVFFVGKVHEWPNITGQLIVPQPIFIDFTASSKGQEKSEQRWLKDRNILLEDITQNPNNLRTMAMLAQTYLSLHDYQNSIKWYEKLITFSYKHNEDLFTNYLYLAVSYELAGQTDKAILGYLKAFQIRPCRAEPLIKLAILYYKKQDFALSFLFVKNAANIPFPVHERGVIERLLYDFTRFEILSSTAHLFKEYELGKQATIEALRHCPNSEELQQQLRYYESMLKK
jgi:tetratricopeptide (TPR) repeat protein